MPDKHVNAFLDALQAKTGAPWDGRWEDWTALQRTRCIKAIMADTLEEHGNGHDWALASKQAALMLCAQFHMRYPPAAAGQPLPFLELQVGFNNEAFGVKMRRPGFEFLPPIPVNGGASTPMLTTGTIFGESMARTGVAMPIDDLPNGVYSDALEQVGKTIGSDDRAALMMLGALFVLWKHSQMAGTIRGGVHFRDLADANNPNLLKGDVVLAYERMTPDALMGQQGSPDGGAYRLVPA